MSGMGISYGLKLNSKAAKKRALNEKRRGIFDDDDDVNEELDDPNKGTGLQVEEIREIGFSEEERLPPTTAFSQNLSLAKAAKPSIKINSKKTLNNNYRDLSTSFTSKKHADASKDLDANIFDYDSIYDSLKPKKKIVEGLHEKKPKYMASLLEAAAVRKRDAAIAEEKKFVREREAEGDEYADKEKFVTSAYKKQQEENRRLEEEERVRHEQEAKQIKESGMTSFYKNMLEKGEQKHAEIVKAINEQIKSGRVADEDTQAQETWAEKTRAMNGKLSGEIIVNDEGEVVDKRQLLTGGLNIVSKPKAASSLRTQQEISGKRKLGNSGGVSEKEAMRERQSRMIEEQLENANKRALEQENDEKDRIERLSKSNKSEQEILSVKERFLARKREAEKAKNKEI
ncbi:Bgt-3431 [Blumeria graminis f. sp. tritici]|uniref:Bgt-3431 n=2 Tax=Blumeria graminis f. sp. tritici TaxID=62690 RepID=A0A061HIQ0_BLUGR|nr:hypothetical protein BGT96224_3431 [Blumeria graminis f. sp. tritici 96224]VDB96377.1 Bgt-3431 [Blumeria graminis f. sp. tritici]